MLFGLLFTLLMYPASFFFLWALFMYTPIGAILAFGTVYYLAVYHNKMINGKPHSIFTAHAVSNISSSLDYYEKYGIIFHR